MKALARAARRWIAGSALDSASGLALRLALLAAPGCHGAWAADLGYAAPPRTAQTPFAFAVDPRCTIAPMPQLDLANDTARFRATAICQSRGLYTDTLIFPGPPVLYRGYNYGHER